MGREKLGDRMEPVTEERWSDELIKEIGFMVGICFVGKEEYVRRTLRRSEGTLICSSV